jgi:hypothetical protein
MKHFKNPPYLILLCYKHVDQSYAVMQDTIAFNLYLKIQKDL